MVDMVKLSYPRKMVLTILWLVFFFMFPQAEATGGNQKEVTLDVKACNMSDILIKICQAKSIKISMNKIINKKIPCDYKGSDDIAENIKYLLTRENCAVIWNYKANKLTSVDVLFFESSPSDSGGGNSNILAMKNQQNQTFDAQVKIGQDSNKNMNPGVSPDARLFSGNKGQEKSARNKMPGAPDNASAGGVHQVPYFPTTKDTSAGTTATFPPPAMTNAGPPPKFPSSSGNAGRMVTFPPR
jgi:hypothetical protein